MLLGILWLGRRGLFRFGVNHVRQGVADMSRKDKAKFWPDVFGRGEVNHGRRGESPTD